MAAGTPPLIPQPFATSGAKNVIPDTSASAQRARYAQGFPAATMQPIDAGGVPPLGEDFNGILFDITSWLFALQGGQLPAWDSDVSDALSGYAKGAVVLMNGGEGYWINLTANNTTDPDAGGAGWQAAFAYGASAISALTGTLRTLTAIEAGKYFLILTGTLVGNQQIVVPNTYRNWLVINNTTGAFTVTVKTGAGTGVVVPQTGAAAPTALWCDTVNVNLTFSPTAIAASVSPVASTILQRDNTGAAFGLTAAVGASTQELATTEFVVRGSVLSGSGYTKNPDGSIDQWGFKTRVGSSPETVNFPLAFPTACFNVVTSPSRASGAALGQIPTIIGSPGTSSFVVSQADGSLGCFWRARGR